MISVDTIPVFTPCLDNATDCSNFFPLFIELSRVELGPKSFFVDQLFLGRRQIFWEVFYLVRGKNPNLHYKIPAMPSFHDKEISSLTRTGLRANSLPSQHDDHKYALRVIKYTKPSYLQNKKSLKVNWKRKLFTLFQSRSVSSSQMLDPSSEYLSWSKEVSHQKGHPFSCSLSY